MPDVTTSFEMGSNLSGQVGFLGMEEFKANLQRIYANISGPALRAGLEAGAEIFRNAITAATPVGTQSSYRTRVRRNRYGETKTSRKRHTAGTARRSVIVYQRKKGLFTTAEGSAYLIGYEKAPAYYMYWYEYGRGPGKAGRGTQPPRPFMRAVYDASEAAALDAAGKAIEAMIGK